MDIMSWKRELMYHQRRTWWHFKRSVPSVKWTKLNEQFTDKKYDLQMKKKNNSVLLLKAKGNRRFCIWIQCNMFCTGLSKYKLLIVGSILMNFSSVHWCTIWWTICLWAWWCRTAYTVFQENDVYWKDSD